MRLAVIDYDLCRPSKCSLECIRFCPVNRAGTTAIELSDERKGKPVIYEETCIGCGICVRKCPFQAISVVNLPEELEERVVHRYGPNAFKLYGLPIPRRGQILGIIGKNGTGKTTILRILAGELRPNLGVVDREVSWDEVLDHFRGTEIHDYLSRIAEGGLRVAHKIQYVELVPRYLKGTVGELLSKADERGVAKELKELLELGEVWERDIRTVSGGELQRLLIAAALSKNADAYFFDEPSSYLDVRMRMQVARVIRSMAPQDAYTVVVEHDLAMLDYLSDNVTVVYGDPGVYGIVSRPYGVRAGINHFLEGYLPAENMRIRPTPIKFHAREPVQTGLPNETYLEWGAIRVRLGGFSLEVEAGEVRRGEVIGIVGPNGIGKTTFIRVLAGELEAEEAELQRPELTISYKPQYLSPEQFGDKTVEEVLREASPQALAPGSWLNVELVRKLRLHRYLDRKASSLSGGELQKLAIAQTLSREADIYLLDEPSAYLDVEERLAVATVIRRIIEGRRAAAFVVEHDVSIQDFISDRLMVFRGTPGVEGHATRPLSLREGMNLFLKDLGITFRRDQQTGRPRVNKEGSYLDRLQKAKGEYYYVGGD